MKPKVYLATTVPAEVEAYIAAHCAYGKWDQREPIPRERLLEEISDAEGLLTVGGRIDGELLELAPRLKVVSNVSVGYNNMDLAAMKKRGVMGTNTPHVLDETVADLAFALILSTARRVPELDRHVKEGKWERTSDERLFGVDVHHKTLGIIGMGRIGEAIARRGKLGFGMEVLYYNRRRKPEAEEKLGVAYRQLADLLRESDFVVLMVPLQKETTHLMGSEQFALMKETAIFINTSRGKTVDEAALIEALREKQIWGAGLDVFDEEPVSPANPLLAMPNVVTLPHIGSATRQTRFAMAMAAAKNLVAAVQGQVPPDLIPELRAGVEEPQ
ncbi:D-glycerate dehydrogenase [Brevibacillus ruminantium]|uniref:D-glycerate dehydrogenase n=1 Tax=Brevibacillus ruminantium TaxID=2950604 RepID=A0ABY4WJN9_9BACL|nr:D-glycerate dehydrogenase [Brevibacillus ruminantium]USG67363.1 D-glycerate dehydrogenase [Brevibacillus ruminantium]